MTKGNKGRNSKGACGGKRKRDGTGDGTGNKDTKRQPNRGK